MEENTSNRFHLFSSFVCVLQGEKQFNLFCEERQ